ncbi:MAG: hypothetical protein JKY09_07150 [Crocinitomicaceae bacterium]|nr:hypothetical protein [Crocinitomicaceae bacterium]
MKSLEIELNASDELTLSIIESGLVTWGDLLRSVRNFRYGRNENRADFSLVWTEQKGSCSSKHAFLKTIADLNKIPGIRLCLGIYKMNGSNTPGVRNVLAKYSLDYLPEAHCYLKTVDGYLDLTSTNSNYERFSMDVLEEFEIVPKQVVFEKNQMHKAYLAKWIKDESIPYALNTLWEIREECIQQLEINER